MGGFWMDGWMDKCIYLIQNALVRSANLRNSVRFPGMDGYDSMCVAPGLALL